MRRWLKRIFLLLLVLVVLAIALPLLALGALAVQYRQVVGARPTLTTNATPGPLGSEVNVFSGTGGWPYLAAYNTPAAGVPWGLVKLAPDTASILTATHTLSASGYYYGDNKIAGFSHTRLVGADAEEGGHFRVFPTTAARAARFRDADKRYTPFSHRDELAFPGYYAVRLPSERVLAEMTATTRCGVHRYTYDGGVAPYLYLEVSSTLGNKGAEGSFVEIDLVAGEVRGRTKTQGGFAGRYGGLPAFFVARFNQSIATSATWADGQRFEGATEGAGNLLGVELGFAAADGEIPLELRLGLSHVSLENARANLEAELAADDFDTILARATADWEGYLGRITTTGGTPKQRRIFYTALKRTAEMPTRFDDMNGAYRFGDAVHTAEGFGFYSDFSLWDTFRTVHPLYNLIARGEQRDMMRSMVAMAEATGGMPRWAAGAGHANSMFGTPADMTIAEAWLKGVRDFDIERAYAVMRRTALEGPPPGSAGAARSGLNSYLTQGYVDAGESGSVAKTLEYAWADHSLALLAEALGKTEDAATFRAHAQHYRNVWNPAAWFFQARDKSGNFQDKFDPLKLTYTDFEEAFTRGYVEGSAMQWRWSVPQDPDGLIALFPSPEVFVQELERYFENSTPGVGEWHPGGNYWHGNEPYVNAVYLFNAAGRPDLTQKWLRWIMENKYADTYYGIDGNDDGGTLSAWYVLSALGFYPIAGTDRYEVGAPLFERAVIDMGEGKTLTVIAENYAPQNIYWTQVTINGRALSEPWFTHDAIADGGEIVFTMRE